MYTLQRDQHISLVAIHHYRRDPLTILHSPPPSPLITTNLFSIWVLVLFLFLESHTSDITQYVSFPAWLISLSIIPSGSIHVVANGKISFFFPFPFLWLSNSPPSVCIYHIFKIHSSTSGRLGCLHILAIVINATVSLGMHVFFSN